MEFPSGVAAGPRVDASGRRSRALVAVLSALTLAVAGCGPAAPTITPAPPSFVASPTPAGSSSFTPVPSAAPTPAGSIPTSAELQALTREITQQDEAIRGLQALEPITTTVLDEAAAREHLTADFERQNPAAYVAASEGLYKRLGLLPAGASLEQLQLDLLASQVLGFYDDRTKQLYVVARSGGVGPAERFTMSHEIDHALQDQHFDLAKVSPDALDQSDRTLAAHALIEGDASLVMTYWAQDNLTLAEMGQILAEGQDPSQSAILDSMPAILRETLEFPYTAGLQLTIGLQQQGGWAAVDAAFADPPASTEQVLHPEKYASHEAPVAVVLPSDLAARMGAGWALALEDTFGELQLKVWLQSSTSSSALAETAAAGWGGDRIGYLTGPGGADAVVLATVWDTPTDAAEFLDAAGRLVADGPSPGTVIRASAARVVVVIASDAPTLAAAAAAAGFPR